MKFEIGDWIECNYANGTRIIAQVSGENKIKENGIGQEFPTSFTEGSGWVKWTPREGEWCWMYSDGNLSPHIMQFSCMGRDCKTFLSGFAGYDYCEPFVGKLPTFIKGN